MRSRGIWLALSVLCLSSGAAARGREIPRYVRTALDDDAVAPRAVHEPRRIRTSLDDTGHAAFPLDSEQRLIRVSLDDGAPDYARLGPTQSRARRFRIVLD